VAFAAAAFVIVTMAMATAALVFVFMIVPAAAAATAVSMAMLVTMTTAALGDANGFELAALELGNGFFNYFGVAAVNLNALIKQAAQRDAVDAGAQHCINRRAFFTAFFVYGDRGQVSGFRIKYDQMARVRKMRFGCRLQAVGFLGGDAEFHGFSSEWDESGVGAMRSMASPAVAIRKALPFNSAVATFL